MGCPASLSVVSQLLSVCVPSGSHGWARPSISGFTAAGLVLWLCTVMGNRCVQQLLEPYPLWFVRLAFKRLRILPRPYRRAAYYHSFFDSLRGKYICVPTTEGLQAALLYPAGGKRQVCRVIGSNPGIFCTKDSEWIHIVIKTPEFIFMQAAKDPGLGHIIERYTGVASP